MSSLGSLMQRLIDASRRAAFVALVLAVAAPLFGAAAPRPSSDSSRSLESLSALAAELRPRIVKIYGAGGFKGLENYQSGLLISSDGRVLTSWSYVLDTDSPLVVLDDGRRFESRLLGADPRLEIALLKIDASDLPCFDLAKSADAAPGARVLALSNLFDVANGDEPVSVQQGVVSAKTLLTARRGAFETPYHGPVYVLDAVTNNPGAAGGALVDRQGRLIGVLGKELRNAFNETWLNYAVPIDEIRPAVDRILSGRPTPETDKKTTDKPAKPTSLDDLGLMMVPEVLPRTPPYVDVVLADSPARQAGLKPDDLVVLVNDRLIQSCRMLRDELTYVERGRPVRMSVMRDGRLVELTLEASDAKVKNRPDVQP